MVLKQIVLIDSKGKKNVEPKFKMSFDLKQFPENVQGRKIKKPSS